MKESQPVLNEVNSMNGIALVSHVAPELGESAKNVQVPCHGEDTRTHVPQT